jgi:tetratricopeptide (TPR) repeat protein
MKNVSRREFLRKSLLASGSFLASFNSFGRFLSASHSSVSSPNPAVDSGKPYMDLQNIGKEYLYLKDYTNAEKTYRKLISEYPNYIPGYDGLAKTFYSQNQSLDAVEVYRQAWLKRPQEPLLSDRFARAIVRLCLGNRKHELEYCKIIGEKNLLNYSAGIYIDAVKKANKKSQVFLYEGFLDVKKAVEKYNKSQERINQATVSLSDSARKKLDNITSNYLEKWKHTRRIRGKNDYRAKSLTEANTRCDKSLKRGKRNLYFVKEKESREKEEKRYLKGLYYPSFLQALDKKSIVETEEVYRKVSKMDPEDHYSAGQMIHLYRKKKSYEKLVDFQRERYEKNPHFWNGSSYAQALRLRAKKESKLDLCESALDIYSKIKPGDSISTKQYINYHGGLIDCHYQLGKFQELQTIIINALEERFPMSFVPFVLMYLKSLAKQGNFNITEKAYCLLLQGLDDSSLVDEPIYKYIKMTRSLIEKNGGYIVGNDKTGLNKESYLGIYYAMYEMYDLKNDQENKLKTIVAIQKIDPENGFAKKRSSQA